MAKAFSKELWLELLFFVYVHINPSLNILQDYENLNFLFDLYPSLQSIKAQCWRPLFQPKYAV